MDNIYPIGSIFISTVKTNPSEYFGGEWEQIKDRFLLACGSTYSNGSTGGEATHVLTELEMPKHWHKTVINFGGNETLDGYSSYSYQSGSRYYNNTSSAGGSQPHNNMPPYLAVYIWKRIS
ncbi:MAG: phage baseplate protein [Romboutsia timonensis]